MTGPAAPRRARQALTAAHIMLSVGLLGDSAGFLAVAIARASSQSEEFRAAARQILAMFALGFGIPLSLLALITGIALAVVSRWGVFRYPWTIAKLGLILSVIVVGATLISPVLTPATEVADLPLVIGGSWDVAALATAVVLAVFKPGRRLRPAAA
jgi:hypothetical protein